MNITESIKFDKLQEENETLKNELDEKDKLIKNLENKWEELVCNNYELQQQQLFKEDFADYEITCQCKSEDCDFPDVNLKYLKDNSKYEKLPSKDVK